MSCIIEKFKSSLKFFCIYFVVSLRKFLIKCQPSAINSILYLLVSVFSRGKFLKIIQSLFWLTFKETKPEVILKN